MITVEIGKGRHCDCEKGIASFDGDTFIPMVTGDCIQIRRADVKTKILKLNHLSFVEGIAPEDERQAGISRKEIR